MEGRHPFSADYLSSFVTNLAFAVYQVHFRVLPEKLINKIKCSYAYASSAQRYAKMSPGASVRLLLIASA